MRVVLTWCALLSPIFSTAAESQCATGREDVAFALAPLQPEISSVLDKVPLIAGAIAAEQIIPVYVQASQTNVDIAPKLPFKVFFAKGTLIGQKTFEGLRRYCVYNEAAFEPAQDDEGRPYPTNCLEDTDNDGLYDTLRMFAYKAAAGKGIITASIAPVRLTPAKPSFPSYKAIKRLRILEINDKSVQFAVDTGVSDLPGDVSFNLQTQKPNPRTVNKTVIWSTEQAVRQTVKLRTGSIRVAGITLRLSKTAAGWLVDPAAAFDPWLNGDGCDGTQVVFVQDR